MFTRNRYPIAAFAAVAVLALAVSVAFANSTTIRSGSSSGPPYSGGFVATGDLVTTHALGTTTCRSVTQEGTFDSDGDPMTVTSADYNVPCSNSDGTTTTFTAQSLPWSGKVTAARSGSAHDGTITFTYMKLKSVRSDGLTCYYEASNAVVEVYNGDNPNRPDTSSSEMQWHFNGETMKKASGSGLLCPSSTSTSGVLEVKGSGGETLYVTH